MKDKLKNAWKWFLQTSMLIGIPVTFYILMMGIEKSFFTVQCHFVGDNCADSIGAQDAMVEYMSDLVGANPGMDIVAKPRRK